MTHSLFRILLISAALLLLSLSFATASPAVNKPAKLTLLDSDWESDSLDVWVFFGDKTTDTGSLSRKVSLPDNTIRRRALRGTSANTDWLDREVSRDYIEDVAATGARLRQQSRWLNAISVTATPEQIEQIARMHFVTELREIATYRREMPEIEAEEAIPPIKKPSEGTLLDYGNSFDQLDIIEVVDLHNQGLTGEGVTVLIMDTGFLLSHEVFLNLDVAGTRDFINGDFDVQDDGQDISQQSHGTSTLSTIGGFKEGTLIGAAYNATYLIAKTEIREQEIQLEEDNWVAAIEWGEQNGADVATSSLGYDLWYQYSDFDGNTAVTTVAADIAASLGVIVVNSIGNGGQGAIPTLNAPSDGDSVIAVGAIDLAGGIASFTSNGPTADGRIKPDIVAPGVSVFVASRTGGYGISQGTSFSCPLAAGVCALLLEANPAWDYGKLYGALTGSATRASNPDNIAGYGIIRASLAVDYVPGEIMTVKGIVGYPNPFNPPDEKIEFAFELEPRGKVELRIYTIAGEEVFELIRDEGNPQALAWDGRNADGEEVAAGVYVAYISANGISETYKIFKL